MSINQREYNCLMTKEPIMLPTVAPHTSEQSASFPPNRPLPSSYLAPDLLCSLTGEPLRQPVRSTKYYIYEKQVLETWFSHSHVEPITKAYLSPKERRCIPFPVLEDALQLIKQPCALQTRESRPSKLANPFAQVPVAKLLASMPKCPISLQTINCPVITEYFQVYECESLERWINIKRTDPIVNRPCQGAIRFDEASWQVIHLLRTAANLEPPDPLPKSSPAWMAAPPPATTHQANRRSPNPGANMIPSGYRGYLFADPNTTNRHLTPPTNP